MWDTLGWGGETQALIYNPKTKKVIGINALGVAPTGATAEFYQSQGLQLSARVRPARRRHARHAGRPDGDARRVRHAVARARCSRRRSQMADGYPIEAQTANAIERQKARHQAVAVLAGGVPAARRAGARGARAPARSSASRTSRRRCASWSRPKQQALDGGQDRARRRSRPRTTASTRATSRRRSCAARAEQGGLITTEDLANWQVQIEEPVSTTYKGIDVYKLTHWTQGPAMLQALNILENVDLKAMGYNSAALHPHALPGDEPGLRRSRLLLRRSGISRPRSRCAACCRRSTRAQRAKTINPDRNDPDVKPGDPYPFQGGTNPFSRTCSKPGRRPTEAGAASTPAGAAARSCDDAFYAGTTSIQAADAEGWVVSVTPSGGWIPAVIAGRTGIGLSQRAQSFVLDPRREPVQRDRARQAPARDADADARAEGRRSRSWRSPCRAATRRTRTCCSSS